MEEAVNLGRMLFRDSDGFEYPVVKMFDAHGDECEPVDARFAVAGTEGRWYALDLKDFGL